MDRRPLNFITREREWELIQRLQSIVNVENHTPDNTAVLMISPDYSATVAMHLAHGWSMNGNILSLIPVNVPYPDEDIDWYAPELRKQKHDITMYDKLILVEAGIIRGSNWKWILDVLINEFGYERQNITLVSMCENIHSITKSDYVAEYYDDNQYELMFYYEKYNKHWPIR